MRYAPNDRRAFKHKKRRPAMKKISTVQADGKEILKEQKLTIGVDLGDRSSFYCVLEEAGKIILEQKVPTNGQSARAISSGTAWTQSWKKWKPRRTASCFTRFVG